MPFSFASVYLSGGMYLDRAQNVILSSEGGKEWM